MVNVFIRVLLSILLLTGCAVRYETESTDTEILGLPEKSEESNSLADSLITTQNLDEYLFRQDVYYVDVRSSNQFIEEGHVAGFINLPYYGLIVKSGSDDFGLFKMGRKVDVLGKVVAAYGEPGSFEPLYQESVSILRSMFPKQKAIFLMSTAGVEAQYLINLLRQYEYDGTQLYNVGNFSNTLGTLIAYRLRTDALYLVSGHASFQVNINYDFGPLTPLSE